MNFGPRRFNAGTAAFPSGNRILTLIVISGFFMTMILARLFYLQVLKYDQYSRIASEQHFGSITLPARRGEILVRETHSGEFAKLATNTTLDLLYVDPYVAEDKPGIAKALAPLLFTQDEYKHCLDTPDECQYNVVQDERGDTFSTTEPVWDLGKTLAIPGLTDASPVPAAVAPEAPAPATQPAPVAEAPPAREPTFKGYNELVDEVASTILKKISKLEVDFVILKRDADPDLMAEVVNAGLPGVFADPKKFLVYADPTLIPENQLNATADRLSALLSEPPATLQANLSRRKVRYVFLKNKLDPAISEKIKALNLKGAVLIPEHWRYYPEGALASNVIGFINREGVGQYGIEGYFNTDLEGKKGTIYAESDPLGRQITVGESKIVNPVDGDTVILTIDRVVQKNVQEILDQAVKDFKADSGQVVIMNPFTGSIVAIANSPTFDPNLYGDVYKIRPLSKGEIVDKSVPVFKKNEKGQTVAAEEADLGNDAVQKYVYENKFGPGALKDKAISEYYEPGSVFKPIVMSIALDAKEVEPQTTYEDDGPLHLDDFEIKNSLNRYYGKTTMNQVLELSLNTGMAFVSKKLGKSLMYKYLNDFGFGQYTDINLEGEVKGRLDYYSHWSKAQLITTAFGQGIIVTPLQMVVAWAALANGGKLVQPYIVDSIVRENQVIPTEPHVISRVIAEDTSSIITSMLINAVKNGLGKRADMPGYLVAGKTGTSQIAGPNGKYEFGEGSYITSFAGYFPALEPKFVMLVKFDRPRMGDNTWGENTAAPTFGKIAKFLVDYYNIEPSQK